MNARMNAPSGADLVIDEPQRFRVHIDTYTDPALFRAEMKRIFERTWVFVGHESEIARPDDFKTAYIGLQPVIVTRTADGAINVLVNRCVHRGAIVTRELRGSAASFTCPYHAWTFANDGSLAAVAMRRDAGGYPDDWTPPAGLYRLPKVATYRGLIFASFDASAPPLETHLGRAKIAIDRKFGRSPERRIELVSAPFVGRYKGNWKFQSENIVDGYHFLFVHEPFVRLQSQYGETTGDFGVHKGGSVEEMRKTRAAGEAIGTAQGHGLSMTPNRNYDALLDGPHRDYYAKLRAIHGADEAGWVVGSAAASIFPNFGIIHHQLRTWRPISVDETEVTVYPFRLAGAPDAINEGWLRSQERFYGPAGYGQSDDVEIFAVNHAGLAGDADPWLIYDRGRHAEVPLDGGDRRGNQYGETSQRAFWRRWKSMMGAA